jgi:protoporphyrinogen oxidase
MPDKILILGAGPAGLFCGYELQKHGKKPMLIEKESSPGGLCRTIKHDKFKFDFGPHIFFTKNKYLNGIIVENNAFGRMLKHEWRVMQYLENNFLIYPNKLPELIRKLGVKRCAKFFLSYLQSIGKKSSTNFKDYIYSKLGKSFADFNVINYTEKMWGIQSKELSSEWIKDRTDRLSFIRAIAQSLSSKKKHFYYPVEGLGAMYNNIAKTQNIKYKSRLSKISYKKNKIQSITASSKTIKCDSLVSSIPLDEFIKLLSPKAPVKVVNAVQSLRYRSQIYLVLAIDKKIAIGSNWIYFPESKISFARIYEPKTFSLQMSPHSKTSLVIEFFCFKGDSLWNMKDKDLYEFTLKHLNIMNIANKAEIIWYKTIRLEKAYPLLDSSYMQNLKIINSYLNSFKNLKLIGRHGLFAYDNQDQAAMSGIAAAREILGQQAECKEKEFIDL